MVVDQTPSNEFEVAQYFVGVLKGICHPDTDRGDYLTYEVSDSKVLAWTLEVDRDHIAYMRERFDFKFDQNEDCWSTDFWDIKLK